MLTCLKIHLIFFSTRVLKLTVSTNLSPIYHIAKLHQRSASHNVTDHVDPPPFVSTFFPRL